MGNGYNRRKDCQDFWVPFLISMELVIYDQLITISCYFDANINRTTEECIAFIKIIYIQFICLFFFIKNY